MNQGAEQSGSKPWFVFEVGDPSQEARAMVMDWLSAQDGLDPVMDDLVELICTDPRDPNDLEGCVHFLVWSRSVEVEELVDLKGAEQLGVLEDLGGEHSPYNVMVSATLQRDGKTWITSTKQG